MTNSHINREVKPSKAKPSTYTQLKSISTKPFVAAYRRKKAKAKTTTKMNSFDDVNHDMTAP